MIKLKVREINFLKFPKSVRETAWQCDSEPHTFHQNGQRLMGFSLLHGVMCYAKNEKMANKEM